jgi:membrane-associated protein
METFVEIFNSIKTVLNPKVIIDTLLSHGGLFAYAGLFAIIFAETGLAVGFFLPGDSLLVVAGVIAAADPRLNVWILVALLFAASALGDSTGYFIGSKMGKSLFNRPNSWVFKPAYVEKAQKFFDKHGAKTIILARFVPIVRTFAPLVAGAAQMPYSRFLPMSLLGSFAWISSMVLAGYFLANLVEETVKRVFGLPEFKLEDNIEKVVIVVVALSLVPMLIEFIRSRREKNNHAAAAPEKSEANS